MFKVLQIEELRQFTIHERQNYIFELASEIGLVVSFQNIQNECIPNYEQLTSSFDDQIFNFSSSFDFNEDVDTEISEVFSNTSNSSVSENSSNPSPFISSRCDSTIPISSLSGSSPENISDSEFSKFLQEHQNINDNVLRQNSLNVRRMRKNNYQKDSTKYLERTSSLDTVGKYGCKLCGQIHFMSSLKQRKPIKPHEPLLYTVRNFLLRYDIAPDVTWKRTFLNGDDSNELDMLERFFSIILPEHENDYQWSYLLRKRSYETRHCTWSSSEGDCKDLTRRNIIDLFVQPYRVLRPYEIRKSPTVTSSRNIITRRELENTETNNFVNNVVSSVSLTNSVFPTGSTSQVTMASIETLFYDPKEFEELDLKRKRESFD